MAAAVARDHVKASGQQVDDLALALVAPLDTNHDHVFHAGMRFYHPFSHSTPRTQLRPSCFARYKQASAAAINWSGMPASVGAIVATPKLAVTRGSPSVSMNV